jgi:hypothetical protein
MRFFKSLVCLISICALLSGCVLETQDTQATQSTVQEPTALTAETVEVTTQPLYSDGTPTLLWGREQLPEHAQAAYDRMSQAIACRQEDPVEVDADAQEVELILTALRIDHPEYFWFDGETSFVTTTMGSYDIRTECTFTYTMDQAQIQAAHQQVRQYTAACLSSASLAQAQTDYEKILAVYRYIINNTDYILSETDQSILSVMDRHQATCAGYARTFQYLMNQLDIPCTLALGMDASGAAHGWNMVQCGGQWYQIDVTWGDPVTAEGLPGDRLQYTYFLVTDQAIYQDHTLNSEIPMPECTATQDNYFIREGLSFDRWDKDALAAAMARAAENQDQWFDCRFSSEDAYQDALDALFTQGQVANLLDQCLGADPDRTRVVYTQNDLFYELSIQLESDTSGRDET